MTPIRILIFAKAPRAGYAKTRLIPTLGADGAAALATKLLEHTLAQTVLAGIGKVELCMSPADAPEWSGLQIPAAITCSDQGEGDLGARLARASERTLHQGEAVILIGTDCPALDAARLQGIADALAKHDAVIVPAHDGGYVALGIRNFHPSLFSDMAWSTEHVASETLKRIAALGWRCQTLSALSDIDQAEDLQHLPRGWLPHA